MPLIKSLVKMLAQEIKNLSITIITLNEVDNLPRLLASMPAGVEIVVVDSGSTDNTLEIAKKHGSKTLVRAFDHYSNQKNAALDLATKDWILSLDADEVPTQACWEEIAAVVSANDRSKAWRIPRAQVFLGKKLRFGKSSDSPVRLFAKGSARFEGEIHEELVFKNTVSINKLTSKLDHYSYKNLDDYFERFNRYTTSVAKNHFQKNHRPPGHFVQGLRFFGEFVWRYVFRGGFLDGYPGFVFSLLGSHYVFIKYAKLELLVREHEKVKN